MPNWIGTRSDGSGLESMDNWFCQLSEARTSLKPDKKKLSQCKGGAKDGCPRKAKKMRLEKAEPLA